MPITIRAATMEDVDAIASFLDKHLRKDWFMPMPRVIDTLSSGHSRCFLAVDDNALVGIALAGGKRPTLYNLLIHPDYRSRGIGKRLVLTVDPQRIRVKTNMITGDPSEFYRKLGYRAYYRDARRNHITIYGRQPKKGEQPTLDDLENFGDTFGSLEPAKLSLPPIRRPDGTIRFQRLTTRNFRKSTGLPVVAVLDANVFIGLQQRLHLTHPLAQLHRRAFSGAVRINVTQELPVELLRDTDDQRRDRQLGELVKFPVVPPMEALALERTVNRLLGIVFPKADPTRPRWKNKVSDCRQLAYAVEYKASHFVTYDQDVLKKSPVIRLKFGLDVVTPEALLSQLAIQRRIADVGPLIRPFMDIRNATKADLEQVRETTERSGESPQMFEGRLEITSDSMFKIIEVDNEMAAVLNISGVGNEVSVIHLLWVVPKYRRRGLGQHLLQHALNSLSAAKTGKLLADVPATLSDLPVFLERFGFRAEGVHAHPSPGQVGLRYARYFVRETVTASTWTNFVHDFVSNILVLRPTTEQGIWEPILQPRTEPELFRVEASFGPADATLAIRHAVSDKLVDVWDTYQLEAEFSPLQLALPGRHAVLVPIKPQWADALFEYADPQLRLLQPKDKRKLRTDNVYYKFGRNSGRIRRGTPLLWYVSKDEQRNFPGGLVASAKVISEEIGPSEEMYEKYGDLGIYSKEAVVSVGRNSGGMVQVIRFGQVEAFDRLLGLVDMRKLLGWKHTPMTATALSYDTYLKVRRFARISD